MVHVERSIVIDAPLGKVVVLAGDPHRWHTWFAGLSEPDQVTGDGNADTVVEHHYLLMGMRFPVTTRVLERTLTTAESQWHATIEGPFDGKQHWSYVAKDDTTQVTARLDYTVPGSLLGKIANRLLIERIQERNIEQTLANLKLLCETAE